MIKKIFSALVVVLFATSMMAQTGLTCNDPIPVDSNYVGRVNGPCTLWYTAWTYDLPLKVHFIPDNDNSDWGPEVEVDLTCTPGIYNDPKLDSLVNMVADFDVSFPIELLCDMVKPNGRVEWDLSISNNYREQMAEFGITYNVQAFVKVTFFEAGEVRLKPDTAFNSCMENLQYVKLGDTLDVIANDVNTAYVFPYTDWQNDSIRFVWIGEQSARVWLGTMDCSFVPEVNNGFVWGYYDVTESNPKKLYTQNMKDAIKDSQSGGLFYAKITAPVAGKLVVEKIPMAAAQGDAILMEYGKTIHMEANDTNQLYCFPRTWEATQFIASTSNSLTMYASPSTEFGIASANGVTRRIYEYCLDGGQRMLYLSDIEMEDITSKAVDDYIYVRFNCKSATSITPELWETSVCASQSKLIKLNTAFTILARSSNNIYRLRYEDVVGYDITISWSARSVLPTYIADACSFTLSPSNSSVVQYVDINPKGSAAIAATTVATWAERVDDEGYLYVRFNPSNQGSVTFTSAKPEVLDPIFTTINEVVCDGGTYTWEGTTYATSGAYTKTFVAANGADSIVTLNLTIRPANVPTTEKVTVRYDEPYTWNGVTYTESGLYTVTLLDAYGCDSVATLELTVLEKSDVKPVDNLVLNLASAFKVYSMDHLAWVAQDVTLNWGGSTPLYVFIAKSKDFALTPYNRYVIHYEEIAAGGSWVLTKEQMASWAAHADADGQLYVRFLTEFEGTLRVK